MIELRKLNTNATNAELVNVASNAGSAIDKAALNDDYLSIENQHMKENIAQMVLGKATDRGKVLREAYTKADGLRDGSMISFTFSLKSFAHGNDEEKAEMAQKVLKTIRKYGNVQVASFETETAQLDSMLLELKQPELAGMLTALNLGGIVAELETNQNSFKALFSQSAVSEAEKKEILAPTKLRKQTLEQLNTMVDYLNIRLRYHKDTYGALAAEIAELINGLNAKISLRAKGGSDETDTPNPNPQG